MDVPETTLNLTIVVPYPPSTKQLRSYVAPAAKKMSSKLKCLQRYHVAFITQALPETKDQASKTEFAMIKASLNFIASFIDGSTTAKTFKEVLKHKNKAGCVMVDIREKSPHHGNKVCLGSCSYIQYAFWKSSKYFGTH
jgi:hypothetical protein